MQSLLDPAILFFVFGVVAGLLKSDLEVPAPIARFLSLYLLMALGLKGGFALEQSGLGASVLVTLAAAILMAFLVPVLGYNVLKHHVSRLNAAAIAASYGSVSAVTFLTAMQHLEAAGMPAGGHMAVVMVIMESPAILMAVFLANRLRRTVGAAAAQPVPANTGEPAAAPVGSLGAIVRESFTNGSHLLLLGALVIGFVSGEAGKAVMAPFSSDLFKGMLAFFLLDMGLLVARNLGALRGRAPVLLAYAVIAPPVHASIALVLAYTLGLPTPDAVLLMVLSASASYIVVPAVLRHAIPEASPSLYFGLSLGITFPLNLLVGIPVYTAMARAVLG